MLNEDPSRVELTRSISESILGGRRPPSAAPVHDAENMSWRDRRFTESCWEFKTQNLDGVAVPVLLGKILNRLVETPRIRDMKKEVRWQRHCGGFYQLAHIFFYGVKFVSPWSCQMRVPRLCSLGCDTGGGVGDVPAWRPGRRANGAVKKRLPCVDCNSEFNTPPVVLPAAVPDPEKGGRPIGRFLESVRKRVNVDRRRCCKFMKNSLSLLAK